MFCLPKTAWPPDLAAAVLAPWHGLFVIGKDLEAAVDAADRIDTNARLVLQMQQLYGEGAVRAAEAALRAAMKTYEEKK